MMNKITTLAVGAATCCACSPDRPDQMAREIAQSIKFDDEAAQTPPHGLPLYPGAKVIVSMMGGMSMGITVDAGTDELAKFYSAALSERGYVIDEDKVKDGSRTIHASARADRTSKMSVAIRPDAKKQSEFTLVFLKLKTSN